MVRHVCTYEADVVARFEQGYAEGLERSKLRALWRSLRRRATVDAHLRVPGDVAGVSLGIAPAGAGPSVLLLGLANWVAKVLVLAAALALLRTVMGRMQPPRVQQVLGVAILLGLLAVVFLFASAGTV